MRVECKKDWKEVAEEGWQLLSWQGEAHWFATKLEGSRKRVMGGGLMSLDQLLGTIRNAEHLHWDLYLNANPGKPEQRNKRKLAREDITHWRHVVVDLDPTPDAVGAPYIGEPDSDGGWWDHARIFSGRGYQLWLPLEGWEASRIPPNAERLMQGYLRYIGSNCEKWAPGWKVDTACSDLARVVRCPGSVNQKTGNRAFVEKVLQAGRLLPVSWLRRHEQMAPEPVQIAVGETASFLDILPHLNGKTKQFIMYGVEVGERHNACYAACRNLHELGVEAERAADWLYIGAQRCWEPCGFMGQGKIQGQTFDVVKALEPAEVRRIVQRVYGGR